MHTIFTASFAIAKLWLISAFVFHKVKAEPKLCAQLYSDPNAQGKSFPIFDRDQSGDLSNDARVLDEGWSSTASVVVESDCMLTTCQEPYLDGSCKLLEQGSHTSSENEYLKNVSSVHCKCQKECSWSDIRIKDTKCGKAFISGGTSICDAHYTDLHLGNWNSFPEVFMESIITIRLQKNCVVTLYTEEDFEGEETLIENEITENFSGNIGSYMCTCLANTTSHEANENSEGILIPESVDTLVETLESRNQNSSQQHGLQSAVESYKHGKSFKNVYILLLGSTGAGKSSTINLLFDRPNLTKSGDFVSTTSEIHEFRIPIPAEDLDIANTELRVIDTPGLGDTRGLAQDAKYLQALDHYLSNHDELKDRTPNVVLIFHKFVDNRFSGDGSSFVKMIRGLDLIRDRITNPNYSNVVFVFSHFCSAIKSVTRRPENRLKEFRKVIENYSLFPKPIHMTVAENKGGEHELVMMNDNYMLPNKELYPQNLIEKLKLVTTKAQDPIGRAVLKAAFKSSRKFQVSTVSFPHTNETGDHNLKYLSRLANANNGLEETEVAQIIQRVWDNELESSHKTSVAPSLDRVKRQLYLHNIFTLSDIPKTTEGILCLMSKLNPDESTRVLLEKALYLSPPVFPGNIHVGSCYNLFKDTFISKSPFNLGESKYSASNFMIPQQITSSALRETKEIFQTFNTIKEYLTNRVKALGISGTNIPENRVTTNHVKPGLNIVTSQNANTRTLTALKEVRTIRFALNMDAPFTTEFQNAVRDLTPYTESDFDGVLMWKEFFKNYGTHVVTSGYAGGAIQLKYQGNSVPTNKLLFASLFQLEELYNREGETGVSNQALKSFHENSSLTLNLVGGDSILKVDDFKKLARHETYKILQSWNSSFNFYPVILESELRLVPLYEIVGRLGQNYTDEMRKATEIFLSSELKYVSPVITELKSQLVETTSKFQEVSLALKKKEIEWQEKITSMQRSNQESVTQIKINHQQELTHKDSICRQNERNLRNSHDSEVSSVRREMERRNAESSNNHWREIWRIRNQCEEDLSRARRRGGCLKAGTLITMADGTERPIEQLKVGDVLLDINLKPSVVLGVTQEFLLDQSFFGFEDNSQFFTSNHLFVGIPSMETDKKKLYVVSNQDLYGNNPLMEYLNVSNFQDDESVKLIQLNYHGNSPYLSSRKISDIFKDARNYSENTLMYDIQVDSSTGTYFANGYVCRHEIPPVEQWPNTMGVLFAVLQNSEIFQMLPLLPYNPYNVNVLEQLTEQVSQVVNSYVPKFYTRIFGQKSGLEYNKEEFHEVALGEENVNELVSRLFSNPNLSSVGVGLYAQTGKTLAHYLDKHDMIYPSLNEEKLQILKQALVKLFLKQLKLHFLDFIKSSTP